MRDAVMVITADIDKGIKWIQKASFITFRPNRMLQKKPRLFFVVSILIQHSFVLVSISNYSSALDLII